MFHYKLNIKLLNLMMVIFDYFPIENMQGPVPRQLTKLRVNLGCGYLACPTNGILPSHISE